MPTGGRGEGWFLGRKIVERGNLSSPKLLTYQLDRLQFVYKSCQILAVTPE